MTLLILLQHCRDDQHRDYVRDKTNFNKLDQLIKTVPCPATFLQKEKLKILETLNKERKDKRYAFELRQSDLSLLHCQDYITHIYKCFFLKFHVLID